VKIQPQWVVTPGKQTKQMTRAQTEHPVPKPFLRRPTDIHTHMILKKKINKITAQLLYLETTKTTE
jgi:hypothetical protein